MSSLLSANGSSITITFQNIQLPPPWPGPPAPTDSMEQKTWGYYHIFSSITQSRKLGGGDFNDENWLVGSRNLNVSSPHDSYPVLSFQMKLLCSAFTWGRGIQKSTYSKHFTYWVIPTACSYFLKWLSSGWEYQATYVLVVRLQVVFGILWKETFQHGVLQWYVGIWCLFWCRILMCICCSFSGVFPWWGLTLWIQNEGRRE